MKVLLLNGSGREGNTKFAVGTIAEGIALNIKGAETEIINVANKKISGCFGCDFCQNYKTGCVIDDDAIGIINKFAEAEAVVFASPVYWCGITAQLKALLDRLYSLDADVYKKTKKIGLLTIGGEQTDSEQYEIISRQFKFICDYLKWDFVFDKAIMALGPGDLKENEEEKKELIELWKTMRGEIS